CHFGIGRAVNQPGSRASQIDIVDSSHSRRLDEAARAAVADWRFVPARQDGTAIASHILVPISFSLQSR
ncbi:energy transducer TonB, partial [Aquitalea magnusonii]|uniref:energy transducer TonB n=1 Tax=Aquitalea magnusonii TaxID=332411 RepID=UPI00128EACD8